jgi:nucleotide-binding universal stress UspA family protein
MGNLCQAKASEKPGCIALHPRDEIVRAATDLSADLLVLSTHGYKGWRHVLFGNDAEKILEHAPCPVLVIR